MWSKLCEIMNIYEAIKGSQKERKIRYEKDHTDRGYLYIKVHNPYVEGVIGTDIKLTFKAKIKILFSKGISVCIGDVFKERREGE